MTPDLWRVLLLLFGCGVLYDRVVEFTQTQLPEHHGVTAWLVVGGVGWTVLGIGIVLGIHDMIVVLLCFIASGSPMIAGSMSRYLHEREQVK